MTVTRADIKREARMKLAPVRGNSVVITLVYLALTFALSGSALSVLNIEFGVTVSLAGTAVQVLVTSVIMFGYVRYTYNIWKGAPSEIRDLFSGFQNYAQVVVLSLLIGIFIFLWSLLLLIPGIVASYRYRMAYYILMDNPGMSAKQALDASKQMMQGNKADLFVMDLSFLGWGILCGLTFGILSLWVLPYMQVSYAGFYKDLRQSGTSAFYQPY